MSRIYDQIDLPSQPDRALQSTDRAFHSVILGADRADLMGKVRSVDRLPELPLGLITEFNQLDAA
jgi:hypothetical protein